MGTEEDARLGRPVPEGLEEMRTSQMVYALSGVARDAWWNAEEFARVRNYEEWFGVSREEIEKFQPESLDEDGIPIPTKYTGKKINGIFVGAKKGKSQSAEVVERPSEPGVEVSKKCSAIKKDGKPCARWALRGIDRCYAHGGKNSYLSSKKFSEAQLESVRLRLVDMSDDAVDVIEKLLDTSVPEAVRLKAATEILDRTGVKGAMELNVEVSQKQDASTAVMSKLAELAERSGAESDSDVIDAEIEE